MKRELVVLIAAAMGLSACGGGSSTSTSTSGSAVSGLALPTEISAEPTNTSAAASLAHGLKGQFHALARSLSALPADSDYNKTSTRKYVDEHALEQFSFFVLFLLVFVLLFFVDAANVNAGPY